jgi:hypothetical protein
VGGFAEDLRGGEDWNFWLRLALTGHRMCWHLRVVCLYRHRADSLSNDAHRMSHDCPEALARVLQRPDFPPQLLEAGRKALAVRHIDGAKRLYSAKSWEEGQRQLEKAISLNPGLIEGHPSRIEDEIVSAALDPLIDDPVLFINSAFANLPANAGPLKLRGQLVRTRIYLEMLSRGLQTGEYRPVIKKWLPHLLRHPGWLVNRTMWGIAVRAVDNRRRRFGATPAQKQWESTPPTTGHPPCT